MVVTLTVAELAVHARISSDPTTDPPEPYLGIFTDILDACTPILEDYAGADTPQATLDLAAVQMAAYINDKPSFTRRPALAFQYSGAEALLSNWHLPRRVVVA